MDIVVTFVIILFIGMAVAPFFLLSGAFGAKKAGEDDGTGLVTPVPGTGDGPVFPKKPTDSDMDGDPDDADDGDDGDDGSIHHT